MTAQTEARRIAGEIGRELERFVLNNGQEAERLTKLLAQCVKEAGGGAADDPETAPAIVRQLRVSLENAVGSLVERDAEIRRLHLEVAESAKAPRLEAVRLREVLGQIRVLALDKGWDDAAARHEIYDISGSA